MQNWSTDEQALKKKDPRKYAIWRLEQLINYGVGEEKLSESELRKYWDELDIDPERRRFLGFLLDGTLAIENGGKHGHSLLGKS